MMKIEKGIPIQGDAPKNGRPRVYPLQDMEVGDSFLAPKKRVDDLRRSIQWAEQKAQSKFLARQIGADVRVWRVA